MKLYVVRHAIAVDSDPQRWPDDGDRPLTKRGRKRFAKAARGLARQASSVDLVLSSPYVRAWDTALILQQQAGWPAPQSCDELREGSPEAILRLLAAHAGLDTLALVGHEPYLGELVSRLISREHEIAVLLRKGAVACLELLDAADLARGARLLWLLQPRDLRRLA